MLLPKRLKAVWAMPRNLKNNKIPSWDSAWFKVMLWLVWLFCHGFSSSYADADSVIKASVIVSRNIKPYIEAVEGIDGVFKARTDTELVVVSLEKLKGKALETLKLELSRQSTDLFLSVGPEATRFLSSEMPDIQAPIFYTVVFNPEALVKPSEKICGTSLRIPVSTQIQAIKTAIPTAKRIGIMFDPAHNSDFFKTARGFSSISGIRLVPLAVSSKRDISKVLKKYVDDVDVLWLIPDRTVSSESIITYIIKEALLKSVPVVGYNRFFFRSGAALAFVFDYQELGRQAAELSLQVISGIPCQNAPPLFHALINTRVFKRVGIPIPEKKDRPYIIEVRP